MSYRGRGRGGGRRDDRREAYQPPPPLSPDERLREIIVHYGDVDAVQELERVAQQIRVERAATTPSLAESFRFAVTEQPFKIPFYAALLRSLYEPAVKTEEEIKSENELDSDEKTVGAKILDEFVRGFLSYLDSAAWRETRFCVHFFAHLAVLGVITAPSFGSLVQALTAVLDEFGVSAKRAKNAALCAAEGLMRAGALLTPDTGVSPTDIIDSIQSYVDSIQGSKAFVSPLVLPSPEVSSEVLDRALAALQTLVSCDFNPEVPLFSSLPPQAPITAQAYALPSILVPPEALPADFTSSEADTSVVNSPQKQHGEWPEYALSLFEPGATPSTSPSSPSAYLVRSVLASLIDIFEVNRKEAVRLLLEFPKWCPSGTFRAPPSKDGGNTEDEIAPAGPQWILEPTIVETVLSLALTLPEPAGGHKLVYYATLIAELCKLAPASAGPAVGKAIRRLYSLLGDNVPPFGTGSDGVTYTGGGLDVDIARRFAEWFAIHMSNFGFGWVWKEWASDLARYSPRHPKRVFIHRAVELEVRLAYYDRVMKTLPEAYREPEYKAVPLVAPGPAYEYEESSHERYDLGASILEELKARKDATEVLTRLDSLRNTLESEVGTGEAQRLVRDVTVQSLLHVGARSFSHLLNALEKYLPVLRALAGSENQRDREKRAAASASGGGMLGDGDSGWGGGEEARQGVLQAAAKFWRCNGQMVGVVFDKLMQYQIVDPHDVVTFAFAVSLGQAEGVLNEENVAEEGTIGTAQWDLMRAALDKANGRVVGARRRVAILRKEAEERRARAKAAKVATVPGEGMDVDGDADLASAEKVGDGDEAMKQEDDQEESPVLATARKTLTALTREQRIALLGALQAFVRVLVKPAQAGAEEGEEEEDVISAEAWEGRERWTAKEWSRWETWGWYKQFCRLYSPYLRSYSQTLSSIAFDGMTESGPSAAQVKKWWNIAVLEEA